MNYLVVYQQHCVVSLTTSCSYLQTCALLAGDENLTTEERKHFFQKILSFAGMPGDPGKFACSLLVWAANLFKSNDLFIYCTHHGVSMCLCMHKQSHVF